MKKLLQKIESKILTKLFTRWVNNEFDTELLELTKMTIQNREILVKSMIDRANYKPILGFHSHLKKNIK